MWEFEVLFTNGERDILFGYSFNDALRRANIKSEDIQAILIQEYVD